MSTWSGFVYVVIDADARRIVGWRVSRTAHASFVLDALEQALHGRRPASKTGLVHQSDRGSQYVSIRSTERSEAGIEPSVGSLQGRGDPSARSVAQLRGGRVRALAWVDCFNHRRLLEPIGSIPPAEEEERYYAMLDEPAMAA